MKFAKNSQNEIVSILGEGLEMVGDVTFTQGIRVDGLIKGRIRSGSSLQIGSKGKVEAEVEIKRIIINGEFRGSIRATERVEINKDGRVFGDIFTPCLIIEAGAVFEGKCNMTDRAPITRGEEGSVVKAFDKSGEPSKGPQSAGGAKS